MAQPLTSTDRPVRAFLPATVDGGRLHYDGLPDFCQTDRFPRGNPGFLRYLQSHFTGAQEERFHATYYDGGGQYLHDEILFRGSAGSVVASARLLFGRALALGATGLLLAHNHPSGRCRPSSDDLSATNRVRDIAAALDIVLLDHLILTPDEIYSMRLGGCL